MFFWHFHDRDKRGHPFSHGLGVSMPRPFNKGITCHGSMHTLPFSHNRFVDLDDDVAYSCKKFPVSPLAVSWFPNGKCATLFTLYKALIVDWKVGRKFFGKQKTKVCKSAFSLPLSLMQNKSQRLSLIKQCSRKKKTFFSYFYSQTIFSFRWQ